MKCSNIFLDKSKKEKYLNEIKYGLKYRLQLYYQCIKQRYIRNLNQKTENLNQSKNICNLTVYKQFK